MTHPSRTSTGALKIRNLELGIVVERQPPDARGMVDSGEYEWADASEPSVGEIVRGASLQEVIAMAAPIMSASVVRQDPGHARRRLIRAIEAGEVEFPSEEEAEEEEAR